MKRKQLNISHTRRNGSWLANICHICQVVHYHHMMPLTHFSCSVKDGVVVLVYQPLHVQLSLFCWLVSCLSAAASDRPEPGGRRIFFPQRYQNAAGSLLYRPCSHSTRSQSALEAPVDKRGGSGKLPGGEVNINGQVWPRLQPFPGPPPFCLYTPMPATELDLHFDFKGPLSALCIHCERVPAVSSSVAYNLSQTRKTEE